MSVVSRLMSECAYVLKTENEKWRYGGGGLVDGCG